MRRIKKLTLCIFLGVSQVALKSDPAVMSLEELARSSDLVATVTSIGATIVHIPDGRRVRAERLRVDVVLKGESSQEIYFVAESEISGFSALCCRENGKYVVFLEKNPNGLWYGVNGPQSAQEIYAAP